MKAACSAALAEATTMYASRTNKLGARKIAIQINRKHSLKKPHALNHATIINQVKQKRVGRSPQKKGPPSKIPICFWELLNYHISMTQMEGREETKPRHLKALIGGRR